jgi:hypothetical protein
MADFDIKKIEQKLKKLIENGETLSESFDLDSLTTQQIILECAKVTKSFMYFLDNYVYFEDKIENRARKLRMWPSQRNIIPDITDSKELIILKARQLGLSWLVAAYAAWLSITKQLHLTIIMSVTEDLAIEFLDRVKFVLDRLPVWLKPEIKTWSKMLIEFKHAGGLISTIKSLPTTEMGAQSKTPNVLILDETCKNKLIKKVYNASKPGIEAADGQVIMISNSIKEGEGWAFTRDIYLDSMHKVNKFKRIFLPWQANPNRAENFLEQMILGGMSKRDVDENYPETEEQAVEDRNIRGVYYAQQMREIRQQNRICEVPYVPGHEVYTFWDLGLDDSQTIWFMQQIGLTYRFIDYYENSGFTMVHYAKVLKEKGYVYGDHYMPHDIAQRQDGSETEIALSKKEIAENLGIEPIIIVKRAKDTQAVLNGIEDCRNKLSQCYFDAVKCKEGIACLENYKSEYDEDKCILGIKPNHDWSSHGADAFRTFGVGYNAKTYSNPSGKNYRNNYGNSRFSYLGG